jgi:hypothetical protein
MPFEEGRLVAAEERSGRLISGNRTGKGGRATSPGMSNTPLVRGHQKGAEARCWRRAESSRVPADPNVGGKKANRHEKYEEGRRRRGHDVSKVPTVPAEHKGESAIPESSATGDNYFTDRPRLKTDR